MRIFLGGTCGGKDWRSDFINMLVPDIEYFNPVVNNWTEDCIKNENNEKENKCDYFIFNITKYMKCFYSIAEVTDLSNKKDKGHVVFVWNPNDWDDPSLKSFKAVSSLLKENGAMIFNNLRDAAIYFNTLYKDSEIYKQNNLF